MSAASTTADTWAAAMRDALDSREGALSTILLMFEAAAPVNNWPTPGLWQWVAGQLAVGAELIHQGGCEVPRSVQAYLMSVAADADFADAITKLSPS